MSIEQQKTTTAQLSPEAQVEFALMDCEHEGAEVVEHSVVGPFDVCLIHCWSCGGSVWVRESEAEAVVRLFAA